MKPVESLSVSLGRDICEYLDIAVDVPSVFEDWDQEKQKRFLKFAIEQHLASERFYHFKADYATAQGLRIIDARSACGKIFMEGVPLEPNITNAGACLQSALRYAKAGHLDKVLDEMRQACKSLLLADAQEADALLAKLAQALSEPEPEESPTQNIKSCASNAPAVMAGLGS